MFPSTDITSPSAAAACIMMKASRAVRQWNTLFHHSQPLNYQSSHKTSVESWFLISLPAWFGKHLDFLEDFGSMWTGKLTKTANFLECVDAQSVKQVIGGGVHCIFSRWGLQWNQNIFKIMFHSRESSFHLQEVLFWQLMTAFVLMNIIFLYYMFFCTSQGGFFVFFSPKFIKEKYNCHIMTNLFVQCLHFLPSFFYPSKSHFSRLTFRNTFHSCLF